MLKETSSPGASSIRDRRETRILESSGAGSFRHCAVDGSNRKYVADTTAQHVMEVNRRESAAWFSEMRRRRGQRYFAALQS